MDRMIYLSMSGAKATMQRQDTLANNLCRCGTHARIVKAVMRAAGA